MIFMWHLNAATNIFSYTSKRNEPQTRPRVRRFAYTVNRRSTREGAKGWGLGGGAVYELLVGLREEDKAKSSETNRSKKTVLSELSVSL